MNLHVERRGAGPLVVFSHGLGQDATAWRHQAGALAERGAATTVAWDLRGHGRSERPEQASDYSLAHALGDLAAVLGEAAAPGEAPLLVGHSFGGYLSLAHALEHPGQVRGLLLVATGPGFRDPDARARWNEMALSGSDRLGVPEVVLNLIVQEDDRVIAGLPSIDVPTVVVVGERDRMFRNAADYMAAKMPRARLVVVEGAGHGVQETHPEPVTETLLDLLAETAPPATAT